MALDRLEALVVEVVDDGDLSEDISIVILICIMVCHDVIDLGFSQICRQSYVTYCLLVH